VFEVISIHCTEDVILRRILTEKIRKIYLELHILILFHFDQINRKILRNNET